MKEMHDVESHTAAAVSLWGHYTHTYIQKKGKRKRDLSAAFYDVQKASLESSCNECCAVPGRVLWQEERFL